VHGVLRTRFIPIQSDLIQVTHFRSKARREEARAIVVLPLVRDGEAAGARPDGVAISQGSPQANLEQEGGKGNSSWGHWSMGRLQPGWR
jgi:hypothetical protein